MSYTQAELIDIYTAKLLKHQSVLDGLNQLIKTNGEHLEGNSMYQDHDVWEHFKVADIFTNNRYNLIHHALNASNVMEIGFNAGHSCLLYLIANEHSKIQLFDLGLHSYSRKCFDYLDRIFPGRLSIIWGDSTVTLPNFSTYVKYDFIHIDGGHPLPVASSDLDNCRRFSGPATVMIFDDTWVPHLGDLVKGHYSKNTMVESPLLFPSEYHMASRYL